LGEGEVRDEVVVSGQLFLGLSVESIDVVIIKFPNDDGLISGSRNEKVRVFSFFKRVSSLKGSNPSVVSLEDSFVEQFG
jgi:hypothetical protein